MPLLVDYLLTRITSAGGIRYEIRSEACDDPGKGRGCGKAFIWINGIQKAKQKRGHNVVVVNQQTGK